MPCYSFIFQGLLTGGWASSEWVKQLNHHHPNQPRRHLSQSISFGTPSRAFSLFYIRSFVYSILQITLIFYFLFFENLSKWMNSGMNKNNTSSKYPFTYLLHNNSPFPPAIFKTIFTKQIKYVLLQPDKFIYYAF